MVSFSLSSVLEFVADSFQIVIPTINIFLCCRCFLYFIVKLDNCIPPVVPEPGPSLDVWEEGAGVEAGCAPGWFRVSGRGERTCGPGGGWTNNSLLCGRFRS